jgi:hypothetical protein
MVHSPSTRGSVRRVKSGILLAAFAFLAGCGGTALPPLTGSWSMPAVSSLLPSEPPQVFNGTLSSNGNKVTGTLYFSNSCFGPTAPLLFSGSIGADNQLKLGSQVYNNQVVNLTGTVSSDGSLLTTGSYTVSANDSKQPSCDNGDLGSLSGARIASLEGSFTGSLTSSLINGSYATTAQLTQASSANNGIYAVTGTVALSSLSCFTSGSITSGVLVGDALTITATSDNATLTIQANINSAAQNITISAYAISGGACADDSGTGTLSQQ